MTALNLPIHTSELRSRPASSARLVNCYAELTPPGASTPVLVTRTPGVRPWAVVGTGPIKAMYADVDYTDRSVKLLYVVSGNELYSVTTLGVPTLIGQIGSIPDNVDMASNTVGLCVVNEPRAFTYDGATFGEITDDDFVTRGAGDVEFLDNHLLFREPDSGRFFGADTGSLTSFDALQFAIADTHPDDLVGLTSDHRQLVCFGEKVSEIYENTGVSGFPFEKNINGTIESGCKSGKTVARQDTMVFWLADDLTVRRLEGATPVRISTHSVEQFIRSATLSSAFAFTYEQEGHFFYALSFNEGTKVFDITTSEWADRQSYGNSNWRFSCAEQFNNLDLVGSMDTNQIGYLDPEYHYEFGAYAQNLTKKSSDLSDTSKWGGTNAAATGDQKDPAGRLQALKLNDDGSTGAGNVSWVPITNVSFKANTDYVVSAKIKPDQLDWGYLAVVDLSDVTDIGVYFDALNGAVGTAGADVNNSGIIKDTDGYWIGWLTFTTAADVLGRPRIYVADADGDITVALDTTSSIVVTDIQVEEGTYPSTYIETGEFPTRRNGILRTEWTYQPVYAQRRKAFHDRLEVVLETGLGATTGQGSDPKIMCEFSDDGGITWRSLPDMPLGAKGNREVRAVWHGMGSSRERVYRMAISDPIPVTVKDTQLEARGGRL